MRRHKLRQIEAHAGLPAGGRDHAHQQPVGRHHVDRAQAAADSQRERGEGDREVVGRDEARGHRLDGQDGVRPHLAALDRVTHPRAQEEALKRGVSQADQESGHGRAQEDRERRQGIVKGFPEDSGEDAAVEFEDAAGTRAPAHVDEVVGAAQELIEVLSDALAHRVLAHRRQIDHFRGRRASWCLCGCAHYTCTLAAVRE